MRAMLAAARSSPGLGALTIAEVQGEQVEVAGGQGGADAGIHAAGEADDGARPGVFEGHAASSMWTIFP